MPTAEEQVFVGGADLTPTFGANAALIEQAIELATTTSYRGLVIYSNTTPATSGEPAGYPAGWYEWHKRCLWLKPATGEVFQWNGTTWALCVAKPGANSIVGSMVASSTLEISKLKPDVGSSLKLIRVNLGETAFEYIATADAFSANSIPISKLDGTSAGSYVLTRAAGSKSWTLFDSATIIGLFSGNEFPIDYLSRGSALQVPMVNSAGTATTWTSVISGIADGALPIAKLAPVVADAGKYLRRNPTTGAVEAVTLVIPTNTQPTVYTSALTAIGATGVTVPFTHGLTTIPDLVEVYIVCATADAGYAVGSRVKVSSVTSANGFSSDDSAIAFTVAFDSVNVKVTECQGWTMYIADGTTGSRQNINRANWQLLVKAVKFN
jgi:hypothetical protein